jgi:hypothetical protein
MSTAEYRRLYLDDGQSANIESAESGNSNNYFRKCQIAIKMLSSEKGNLRQQQKEWEIQAVTRVWRPGQRRPVTAVNLFANKCDADTYKAKMRDKKHSFDAKAINAITKVNTDGVPCV